MKSKAQKDREVIQELGRCFAEGLKKGLEQDISQSISIPIDINPKEPFEFVGRVDGPPLTQYRNQRLRNH